MERIQSGRVAKQQVKNRLKNVQILYMTYIVRINERSSVSCSARVQYILNVTREIDNFFPGVFEYHNIRVYDEEATDLLAYWNDTYKFISRAK